jgi:hypothetical protein
VKLWSRLMSFSNLYSVMSSFANDMCLRGRTCRFLKIDSICCSPGLLSKGLRRDNRTDLGHSSISVLGTCRLLTLDSSLLASPSRSLLVLSPTRPESDDISLSRDSVSPLSLSLSLCSGVELPVANSPI